MRKALETTGVTRHAGRTRGCAPTTKLVTQPGKRVIDAVATPRWQRQMVEADYLELARRTTFCRIRLGAKQARRHNRHRSWLLYP